MTRIAISREIPVERERVWVAIADLTSHTRWMRDAESIVFTGKRRAGVGTRMKVRTAVGPFRTTDVMEVVGWEEGHSIEVTHEGVVKGRGRLSADPSGDDWTVVAWVEELTFPWWLGGVVTAWLARPVLAAIWQGNLERLEEVVRSL